MNNDELKKFLEYIAKVAKEKLGRDLTGLEECNLLKADTFEELEEILSQIKYCKNTPEDVAQYLAEL